MPGDRRISVVTGVTFVVAAMVSLVLASLLGAAPLTVSRAGLLALGGVLTLVAVSGETPLGRATAAILVLQVTVAVVCLACLSAGVLPERPYGDGAVFSSFVTEGRVVPRWLVGSTAASTLHAAVWGLPPVAARLPVAWQSANAFLALLGTVCMVGGTLALLRRWPGRLSVLLPALTPVWLLFMSGYTEYYPLIAVPFVAVLAWVFERPLGDRTPTQVGALVALLPLVYIGFLPVACLTLGAWAVVRPEGAARVVATGLVVAAVTIAICWPLGIPHYFQALYGVMNFGEANMPARYVGLSAGPTSLVFSLDAVLTMARAREVGALVVWGGGWWTMPLLLAATWRAWRAGRVTWLACRRDVRMPLGIALVGVQVYYLAFMVPRLGPVGDVDLFFTTYLTLAFMAGRVVDAVGERIDGWRVAAVACALAALAVAAPWLVWYGLPPVP